MNINLSEHRRLLIREYELQKDRFEDLLNSSAAKLRESGKLYVAQYAGFDDSRGNLLLRLSTKFPIPRRNEHVTGFVTPSLYSSPKSWGVASYLNIRSNPQRLCELTPIWFQFETEDRVLVGFRGADISFMNNLPANIPIILGPAEPPLEYLRNLIYLVEHAQLYPRFKETVSIELDSDLWNPDNLDNTPETSLHLSAELAIRSDIIIQGPPGTGKSFLIANLCADFLRQGKTVLVTALTNAALVELGGKDGLKESLSFGKIYKTSLTIDESRQLPKLKNGSDFDFKPSTLLLATYYKISDLAKSATGAQFDLVIAEEASQAFLATLGAIRHLGKQCVIIGDQMQLEPIRILKDQDLENPELIHAFKGLNSVANSYLMRSKYILTKTFRLSPFTTYLTNAFYSDKLKSIQTPVKPLKSLGLGELWSEDKSVSLVKRSMPEGLKIPFAECEFICEVVYKIRKENPGVDIAVLSFFVDTVKELQKRIYSELGYGERVVVETVDRIQGLTVDICIFLIPNTGLSFSLNPNRFNVATSRARYHTFIVAPQNLNLENYDPRVKEYFERLEIL